VLAAIVLGLGLVARPGALFADEQADFELAKSRFEAGRYEEAADKFAKLLSTPIPPKSPRAELVRELHRQARPLYAAALIGLGKEAEADKVLLRQLEDDPFYELPPGKFPEAVSDRFIAVKSANRAQIEEWQRQRQRRTQDAIERRERLRRRREARLRRLEDMARYKTVEEVRERWVAAVPFGVGQFYNESYILGSIFATLEAGAFAAAIGTAIAHQQQRDVFVPSCTGPPDLPRPPDPETGLVVECEPLEEQLKALQIANWVTFWGGVAIGVAGIIEAQLSFKPKVTRRERRALPPEVPEDEPETSLAPMLVVSPQGAFGGLSGRF
jgi:tetratricopeptide (TPR) repeat protein